MGIEQQKIIDTTTCRRYGIDAYVESRIDELLITEGGRQIPNILQYLRSIGHKIEAATLLSMITTPEKITAQERVNHLIALAFFKLIVHAVNFNGENVDPFKYSEKQACAIAELYDKCKTTDESKPRNQAMPSYRDPFSQVISLRDLSRMSGLSTTEIKPMINNHSYSFGCLTLTTGWSTPKIILLKRQ